MSVSNIVKRICKKKKDIHVNEQKDMPLEFYKNKTPIYLSEFLVFVDNGLLCKDKKKD